jgi:hypothetical protein
MKPAFVALSKASLLLAAASPMAASGAPPPGVAVLTPGAPAVLRVTSLDLLGPAIGVSASVGDAASKELTALARKEGFDPAERISAQLVGALRAAGRDVVAIRVARQNAKGPRPLERDELPPDSDGRLMLDVTLQYVAVAAITEFSPYRPAVGLSYRLLDEKVRIAQGSKTLFYRRLPSEGCRVGSQSRARSMACRRSGLRSTLKSITTPPAASRHSTKSRSRAHRSGYVSTTHSAASRTVSSRACPDAVARWKYLHRARDDLGHRRARGFRRRVAHRSRFQSAGGEDDARLPLSRDYSQVSASCVWPAASRCDASAAQASAVDGWTCATADCLSRFFRTIAGVDPRTRCM